MNKKIVLAMVLLFCGFALGADFTQKQIQFVNEWGDGVNMGTSVSLYIYDVGTTTELSCYLDRGGNTAVTQPVTYNSTNTAIDYTSGILTFWTKDADYKITVTDGTYTRTLDNLTASDTRMMWPTFLVALSSYSLGQSEDLDFTYGAWVMDGDTAGRLDMIPDAADGILGIGSSAGTQQGDVYIYASSTEFMYFDQSGAEFNFTHIDAIVDDDSTLYFGDGKDISFKFDNGNDHFDMTGDGSEFAIGATGAGLDVYIWGQTGNFAYFDEDNDRTFFEDWDLRINEGGLIEYAGTDNAVDWTIQVATAERLEFIPTETSDDQVFNIGNATNTSDFTLFGATASTTLLWDASDDELEFVLADLKLSQGSQIEWIDVSDSLVDWTLDLATDDRLTFTPTLTDDTASIHIGDATNTGDLALFGATASTVLFDASGDEVIFDAYDISMGDADVVKFGDGDDISLHSTTAKYLTVTPAAVTDDYGVVLGVDQSGVDLKAFAATTNEYVEWDASADSFTVVGDLALFTLTGTTKPFYANITGTVAGVAAEIKTTDGGIKLDADGAENGDIAIDAADDMTVTAAGDFTLAVTGTTTLPDDVLRKAVVEIDADEADNLAATQIELVATPGGTSFIEFVSAAVALDYGGTAWTEPSAPDDLAIRYTDGNGAIVSELLDATGFADATADTVVFLGPTSDIQAGTTGAIGVAKTACSNQALVLDNTGSEWTNSGNSIIQVIVYYRIHTDAEAGM